MHPISLTANYIPVAIFNENGAAIKFIPRPFDSFDIILDDSISISFGLIGGGG